MPGQECAVQQMGIDLTMFLIFHTAKNIGIDEKSLSLFQSSVPDLLSADAYSPPGHRQILPPHVSAREISGVILIVIVLISIWFRYICFYNYSIK